MNALRFVVDIRDGNLYPFSIRAENFFSHMKRIFGDHDIQSEKDIIFIIHKLIDLAKVLCRRGEPVELLKESYLTETGVNVKKKILSAIFRLKGDFQLNDPVVLKTLRDKDDEITFLGIRLLGEKGYKMLKILYDKGQANIKKHIILYLSNKKETAFFDYFLKKVAGETDLDVKQALVDYFVLIDDKKAEPYLRGELFQIRGNESTADFLSYKSTVINALKRLGTYETIEALCQVKHSGLKRDADEAIAAIRDRIGSGDKGWLSIDQETDESGKLSILDKSGGNN